MKKTIKILLLGALTHFLVSWHPYIPNLDKKEENLKGPVKTVIEYISNWGDKNIVVKEYNKQGKLVEIKYYGLSLPLDNYIQGDLPDSITSLQDTSKLKLLSIRTYDWSNTGKNTMYKIYDFTAKKNLSCIHRYYDNNDSLVAYSDSSYNLNDSLEIESTNIYRVKQNNILVETVCNSSDTVFISTYQFNEHDLIEKVIVEDCIRDQTDTVKYIYDQYDRLVLKTVSCCAKYGSCNYSRERYSTIYDESGKLVRSEEIIEGQYDSRKTEKVFIYNSLGKKTKELRFNYDRNMLEFFSETSFNQNNDYTSWYGVDYFVKENVQLELPSKEICEHTYDAHGNWTKVKKFMDGQLEYEDERIINYHRKKWLR